MSTSRQYPTLSPKVLALLTYRQMLDSWTSWRDLALPTQRVKELVADSIYRFVGDAPTIYSRMRSGATDRLFERLELSTDIPVLVAYTCSLDEISANRLMLEAMSADPLPSEQPFVDQISWLSHLIEWAESGKFQLIIRVHPREDSNRRERTSSQHLRLLREKFDHNYKNVRIVWPRDDVSSYDLMEIADAGTSAWSWTTLEMARLGVPAVVAFQRYTPMPIPDVVSWGRTPEEYLRKIEEALRAHSSLDRLRFATRWMNLRLFGHSIDLSDVVPSPQYAALPPYKTPASASIIEDVLINGMTALELNRRALEASQTSNSGAQEEQLLLSEIRQAIWLLTFNRNAPGDYRLYNGKPAAGHIPDGYDAAAWPDNGFVVFQTATETVRRRSRMVERLIQISAQGGSPLRCSSTSS